MSTPGRLLIVSNRLPVSAGLSDGALQLSSADGGRSASIRHNRCHGEVTSRACSAVSATPSCCNSAS